MSSYSILQSIKTLLRFCESIEIKELKKMLLARVFISVCLIFCTPLNKGFKIDKFLPIISSHLLNSLIYSKYETFQRNSFERNQSLVLMKS